MHYLFLIATEKQQVRWWIVYVVCGFFAVHTTILFYLTLLAHFIYTLVYYREKWRPLLLSQFIIFLTSVPWLIYIFINRSEIQQSLEWQIKFFGGMNVFQLLIMHYNYFIDLFAYFFKLGLSENLQLVSQWIFGLILFIAIYVFFRKADNKQKWFVGLITFLGVIGLITLDLIRSSGCSNVERYLLLNFIGLIILVSFAVQKAIEKQTVLFGSLFLLIISLGILSSFSVANDLAYGKRADAYYHVQDAAHLLSGKEHILIISDFYVVVPKSYTAFMSLINASSNKKY